MSLFKLVRSFVEPTAASNSASPAATPTSPLSPHSSRALDSSWRFSSPGLSPSMPLERATVADSMHQQQQQQYQEDSQLRSGGHVDQSQPHVIGSTYTVPVHRSLKHRWESRHHSSRSQRRRLYSSSVHHMERAEPLHLGDGDADSDMSGNSEEDGKHSLPSSQSSAFTSFASSPSSPAASTHSVLSPPSVAVRVSMSVAEDYSAMLTMGYTVRQARYATRLFNGDQQQALLYLLDMEQHKDALEIQIVQAELETADEKDREESGSGRRQLTPSGSTSTWMRIFPRFTALSNTLASLSPQSASLRRTQSQPLPDAHTSAHSHGRTTSSLSPSPIPMDDPAAPLSRLAIHPPVPSPPAAPNSPFACDTCTYVNEALGTTRCEMCGENRPESFEQRNWSASLRQCGVCFDLFPLSSMCTSRAPCAHLFCWSCFHSYLLAQLDENRLLDLPCPEPSCSRPILSSEVKTVLSPYHYARYRRFRQQALLAADPRVRYCPNRRCQNILYGSTDNPRMHCERCGEWSCYTCQIPWHEGLTCLQVLRHTELRGPTSDDVAFLQSMHAQLGSRYRQCVGCSVWVERSAGCAKMTCRCGARWCFECGVVNATCNCTPRYHVFYPLGTVLNNWNNEGPG